MNCKPLNMVVEKLKLGFLFRVVCGTVCNISHPEYNLFKALALKSGLPGSDVFKFTTDGNEVTLLPLGQSLNHHRKDITDLDTFKRNLVKSGGMISWIKKFRLYEREYLSEFVKEGPARIHYLPEVKRLAVGAGRNRLLTLMRLGYRNAKQLKQAKWSETKQRYVCGDIVINYPGKPIWDDVPPNTCRQGWVDKTKRWTDANRQGLRLTLGDIYKALFR
jgi:hypothetical protein